MSFVPIADFQRIAILIFEQDQEEEKTLLPGFRGIF